MARQGKYVSIAGSPNSPIAHPDGLACYGRVPEIETKNDFIPAGDIFLRVGRHTGPNRGFGVNHIWAEHEKELAQLGYDTISDVARFVRILSNREHPFIASLIILAGNTERLF